MLFLYEFKKLIGNKFVIRLLILLLVINAVSAVYYIQNCDSSDTITAEEYCLTYDKEIQKVIDQAVKNLVEYESHDISADSYMYKYQTEIITRYSKLKENVLFHYEEIQGWTEYFQYNISDICAFALILITSMVISIQDSKIGITSIISTTKNGRNKTIISKALLSAIISAFAVGLFYVETLCLFNFRYNLSITSNALQAIDGFLYCPYEITVFQYLFISYLLKTLSVILFVSLLTLISEITSSYIVAFVSGLLYWGASYLLNVTDKTYYLNPVHMTNVNSLFYRFNSINILTNVVDVVVFSIFVYVIASFIMYALMICISMKRQSRSSIDAIVKNIITVWKRRLKAINRECSVRIHCKSHSLSIFIYETYKLFVNSHRALFLLILVLAKCAVTSLYFNADDSNADKIYSEYMCVLAGELSESKTNYVENERVRIDTILGQYDIMKDSYNSGEISRNEYSNYLSQYYDTYAENKEFLRIENHYEYIDNLRHNGNDAWFVYDTGWLKLLQNPFDWTLYVIIIILFSSVFSSEYRVGMMSGSFAQILRATKKGRRHSFFSKYAVSIVFTTCISLLWFGIELYAAFRVFDMPLSMAPVHSIEVFENVDLTISIKEYLVLHYLIRYINSVLLSVFVCSLSAITKRTISSLIIVGISTVFPHILAIGGISILKYIDFIQFFTGVSLISGTSYTVIGTFIFIICVVALTIMTMTNWSGVEEKHELSFEKYKCG